MSAADRTRCAGLFGAQHKPVRFARAFVPCTSCGTCAAVGHVCSYQSSAMFCLPTSDRPLCVGTAVQASIAANTYVVSGPAQTKSELLSHLSHLNHTLASAQDPRRSY